MRNRDHSLSFKISCFIASYLFSYLRFSSIFSLYISAIWTNNHTCSILAALAGVCLCNTNTHGRWTRAQEHFNFTFQMVATLAQQELCLVVGIQFALR